jgi:hypothetical protein
MNQQKLSPKKYIVTKARQLPFGECFINETWEEEGMASILVSRAMPSGKFIIGLYNVDVFCLGLKNTLYKFGLDEFELDDFIAKITGGVGNIEKVGVNKAHNIIYGSIDYAEELGFAPHGDFKITEYILDPEMIDDGIDTLEFGKDGQPYYVSGPSDNVQRIMGVLKKNIGEGNFKYLFPGE